MNNEFDDGSGSFAQSQTNTAPKATIQNRLRNILKSSADEFKFFTSSPAGYPSSILDRFGKKRVIKVGVAIAVVFLIMFNVGVFRFLFYVGMLVLIVGMARPALAEHWIVAPTRKKIFGMMLIYLIPVAVLSNLTKAPSEYSSNVDGGESQSANSNLSPSRQQFANALLAADTAIRRAKRGNQSQYPGCSEAIGNFYNFKKHESGTMISDYLNSPDPEMGFRNAAMQITNMYIPMIQGQCAQ